MTRAWRLRAAPVAMLLVAACQDTPTPTIPVELPEDDGGELSFFIPEVDPSLLVVTSHERVDSLVAGPARVIEEGEQPPDWGSEPDPGTAPAAAIWDAYTRVGFQPGSAWALGNHRYQGNKGKIETTVSVYNDGAEIGRQSAHALQDIFFLADFGLASRIQVIARAFVNQECGLMARGDSDHEAWWEPLPLVELTSFGRAALSSYSYEPAYQPECIPEPPPPTGGGGGGEGGYCWVAYTYDEMTGEIVDWYVLSCETTEGG